VLLLERRVGVHAAPGELVFPSDALVAVRLAFDAVLGRVCRFGEQANDLEELASDVLLTPIGRKADCLANFELMGFHRTSQQHLALLCDLCGAPDQALTVADGPQRGLDDILGTGPNSTAARDEIARF